MREMVRLVSGALAAGSVAGSVQYFCAVRVPACGASLGGGCGLTAAEFLLALHIGGTAGAMLGIPTGLVAWFVMLDRRATAREVRLLALGSIAAAGALGAVLAWLSVFFSPLAALMLAAFVRVRRANFSIAALRDGGRGL
jgi:hypothetical protein